MPPLGVLTVIKNNSDASGENKIFGVVLTIKWEGVMKIAALLKLPDPPIIFYRDPREGEEIHRFFPPI